MRPQSRSRTEPPSSAGSVTVRYPRRADAERQRQEEALSMLLRGPGSG
jgi:hypothetical protein